MLKRTAERWRRTLSDWWRALALGVLTAAFVWTVWHFTRTPCIPAAAEAGLCHLGVIAQYINVDILLKAGSAGFAAVAIKGGYDRYMMRDMLNREQKARQHAEERLAEARQDADDARKELAEGRQEAHQMMIEAQQQLAEARRQASATQQQASAAIAQANQRADAAQQQVSAAIAQANQRADAAQNMFAELVGDFREERRQAEAERRQAEADRRQAEAERRQQAATQQAIMETMLQLLQRQVNGQRPAANGSDSGDDASGQG